jgi:hypothetical protein
MQVLNRAFPKIIIGLAGAVLIALAVIVLIPSSAPAQPVISWVPESLNETVLAGETKTLSASFTASQDLGAVEVGVVPELEPFVQTNPTSFQNIVAGQEVSLEIIIMAPEDTSPQVVEGTIQIRNAGQPPRNFARPLPVTVNIRLQPTTPENALRQLAHDLQTNNTDEILKRFTPSPINHEALMGLSTENRNRFSQALDNAELLKETESLIIYLVPWTEEDGSIIELEITLAKNDIGEWFIISW